FLNWLRGNLRQRAADDLHDFLIMTIDDGGNQRLFAWVILVKRTNAHARHFSDAIGAGFVETLPDQNASSRFDQRVNRRARSRLRRVSWVSWAACAPCPALRMRVGNTSYRSYSIPDIDEWTDVM